MKRPLPLVFFLCLSISAQTQITAPMIKAGFGVDADLRANYYNGFLQSGNDDWFGDGTAGTGSFVIDTNGAAGMVSRYLVDPAFRKLPFFRTMRVPQFSVVNNRLWIDAVYIRDYNGQSGGDSTAFVTSNKNGDSPGVWGGGVTSVLDKNDIAEMMIHVKRAGPQKTDSLWFMGGMSLQGTSGNRYFDFELYQTDIFYSRSTGKFSNYGPDAGHTSWQLNSGGEITVPGDVIFSAEYSSASLSNIEARIWVHRSALSINPVAFDWIGGFDGAGSGAEYGYANIRPKAAGAYYTGLQSGNNTWTGPYGFIDGGNNFLTTYTSRQFMEFSVNLSKLGLDPITLLGGSACGLPFRRILVKSRTSTSFSSELKDFIGPFDFFVTAPVKAVADVPIYCGVMGVSTITVQNPLPASVYTWSTADGRIVGSNVGSSITVDTTGTYIVSQQLLDGCSTSSKDTVRITFDGSCKPLVNGLIEFEGNITGNKSTLRWTIASNETTRFFELQRSTRGSDFKTVAVIDATQSEAAVVSYGREDDVSGLASPQVFYRLVVVGHKGVTAYSKTIRLQNNFDGPILTLYPNPATRFLKLSFTALQSARGKVSVYDAALRLVHEEEVFLQKGGNERTIGAVAGWQKGVYILSVQVGDRHYRRKFIVTGDHILNRFHL
jgi:hypothetical protein